MMRYVNGFIKTVWGKAVEWLMIVTDRSRIEW
jgi:hypothetical protein